MNHGFWWANTGGAQHRPCRARRNPPGAPSGAAEGSFHLFWLTPPWKQPFNLDICHGYLMTEFRSGAWKCPPAAGHPRCRWPVQADSAYPAERRQSQGGLGYGLMALRGDQLLQGTQRQPSRPTNKHALDSSAGRRKNEVGVADQVPRHTPAPRGKLEPGFPVMWVTETSHPAYR